MKPTIHYIPAESEDMAVKKTLEGLRNVTAMRMLTDLSTRCLTLSEKDAEAKISKALGKFAENIQSDHAYLFYYDFSNNTMSNSAEWRKMQTDGSYKENRESSTDGFDYWVNQHKRGNSIWTDDINSIPEGNVKQTLIKEKAKSHVSCPLMQKDECIGFIGFDWIKDKPRDTRTDEDLIGKLAAIISGVKQRIMKEKKLQKKLEESQKSNNLKSAYLASIGHELKTPLNAIMGYSELLKEIAADDDIVEYSHNIYKNGDKLLYMLDDILELAVAEQNKVQPKYESLRIRNLTNDLEFEFYEALLKSDKCDKIKLSFSISDELLPQKIMADRQKINEIMNNLFRNAVKYTSEGEIIVGVKKQNNNLVFWIKDTGHGISEDQQKEIFDFFKRGNDNSLCKNKGLGVGLAISKKLATTMDGDIFVKSRQGEGALFSLTIPFISDPLAKRAEKDS
ncbi:MAG: GAF domain-containing sensor histidine kinase [bacterium]